MRLDVLEASDALPGTGGRLDIAEGDPAGHAGTLIAEDRGENRLGVRPTEHPQRSNPGPDEGTVSPDGESR